MLTHMNKTSQRVTGLSIAGRLGSRRHHSIGFWVAAIAFLLNMGFSAVPTPLYVLYQHRDGISNLMVTVVYAVYAVGVIASLSSEATCPTGSDAGASSSRRCWRTRSAPSCSSSIRAWPV